MASTIDEAPVHRAVTDACKRYLERVEKLPKIGVLRLDYDWQKTKGDIDDISTYQSMGFDIKPRPLSRTEVDRIFKRAAEKKTVVKVDLTEGDQILVTAGPFKDFQGEVIEVSGERNKLKALLSIFGRETPVELEFSQISKQN